MVIAKNTYGSESQTDEIAAIFRYRSRYQSVVVRVNEARVADQVSGVVVVSRGRVAQAAEQTVIRVKVLLSDRTDNTQLPKRVGRICCEAVGVQYEFARAGGLLPPATTRRHKKADGRPRKYGRVSETPAVRKDAKIHRSSSFRAKEFTLSLPKGGIY